MGKKDGGRSLNPADKLRKEQAKKEAKKNAERRAATRAAIVSQKSEDELRATLAQIKRAEAEGRADGKQLQMRKQIEQRLDALKKEAESQPKPYAEPVIREKSLEELYPDAEGSIYYHPIENPYGVPPPGCLPMWKPGYIPKAQRHLLPIDHPLHPDYRPPSSEVQSTTHAQVGGVPPSSSGTLSESSRMNLDDTEDEGTMEVDELDELEGIPPPPEEADSDGDNPPPAPPTTEDDVPGVVYDDIDDGEGEEGVFDEDSSAYFEMDEVHVPPAKRLPPPPTLHPNGPFPPMPPNAKMPMMPPMMPPPFGFPPPPGFVPPMPAHPGAIPFPPPGFPMPPHADYPPVPRTSHQQDRGQQHSARGKFTGSPKRDSTRHSNKKDADEIPDPLDMGPFKKESRGGANPRTPTASMAAAKSGSAPTTTSEVNATNVTTATTTSLPVFGPKAAASPAKVEEKIEKPRLVPASVRAKRTIPGESRPVAPRMPAQPAQAESAKKTSSSTSDASYEAFLSEIKDMGAVP